VVVSYPQIKKIINVELDPEIIEFSRNNEVMKKINNNAFDDPRMQIVIQDAFLYIQRAQKDSFDVVIKDFPEGVNEVLAKSFSVGFFKDVKRVLKRNGIFMLHVDSYDTRSYWTVVKTLREAGFDNILTLEDTYWGADGDEGLIAASQEPFEISLLNKEDYTRKLIEGGILPPIDVLKERSGKGYIDQKIIGMNVNTKYRLTYLDEIRKESGFVVPLSLPIGTY